MNDSGDLTPPVPPDAPPPPVPPAASPSVSPAPAAPGTWWSGYRKFVIPVAGVAVIGAAVAATFLLVLKPAPAVEKMVPASANVLVIANVDPSATQKLNLMRAVHSFPVLGTDKAISDKLDQALKDTGLTFSGDIAPWLGAEVGFSGQISLAQSKDVPGTLYLASRDDAKAQAMLGKLRTGPLGSKLSWQDQSYSGITVSVGTPKTGASTPAAYAYVDHVVVIGSSGASIHDVIDTDQGRAARLVDSANYKATLSGLPTDRVAVLYVDGKSLVAGVRKQLSTMATLSTGSMGNLADLDAFQGIGGTLSANGNGVLADMVIRVDQSKLTPATRAAMANTRHPDVVLRWIPKGSDAFLAFGTLNQTIKALLDQAGSGPTVSASTDALGLTGPSGVLPHLTGDAGLELEVGARVIPAGAILLGTNDPASMNAFLKKVIALATELGGSSVSGGVLTPSTTPQAPNLTLPAPTFRTTRYRGVLITFYGGVGSGAAATAFQPAYAVTDGMGILSSNVAEAKAVIDAHLGAGTVAADATYQTALSGTLKQPSGILYLNVGSLVDALHRFSAESGLASVDTQALANLAPVKAVILTASSQADAWIERLFVVVK